MRKVSKDGKLPLNEGDTRVVLSLPLLQLIDFVIYEIDLIIVLVEALLKRRKQNE
jgi:hypothetical protein